MRKQVDFITHVWALGNTNNERTITSERLTQIVRGEYLSKGYEVFHIQSITFSGSEVMCQISFVKYEEVEVAVKSK